MDKILKSPYDLVADVLKVDPKSLNEDSAMGETLNWDSLNHLIIIGEIENSYSIKIPNEDIEKYATMKAIIEVYTNESGGKSSKKGLKEFFKRSLIGRMFFK